MEGLTAGRLRLGGWAYRLRHSPGMHQGLPARVDAARRAERDPQLLQGRATSRLASVLDAASRAPIYPAGLARVASLVASGSSSAPLLEELPILSRESARCRMADLLSGVAGRIQVTATSGTASGRVGHIVKPASAALERAAIDRRWFDRMGVPGFFDLVMVVPWSEPGAVRWGFHDWRIRCRQVGLEEVERAAESRERLGQVLVSSPAICQRLVDLGLSCTHVIASSFEPPRTVGARLGVAPAAAPEAAHEAYAASEMAATMAFRFPGCPMLHVNSDAVLIESVDPQTGASRPDGAVGRLLVTDLLNTAMPLVRYAIGDIGAIASGRRCPCGRATPTLLLLGRDRPMGIAAQRFTELLRTRSHPWLLVQTSWNEVTLFVDERAAAVDLSAAAGHCGLRLSVDDAVPDLLRGLLPAHLVISVAERHPVERCRGLSLGQAETEPGAARRDPGSSAPSRLAAAAAAPACGAIPSRSAARRLLRDHHARLGRSSMVTVLDSSSMAPLVRGRSHAEIEWGVPLSAIRAGSLALIACEAGVLVMHRAVAVDRHGEGRILQMPDRVHLGRGRNPHAAGWVGPDEVLGVVRRVVGGDGTPLYSTTLATWRCTDMLVACMGRAMWWSIDHRLPALASVLGAGRAGLLRLVVSWTRVSRVGAHHAQEGRHGAPDRGGASSTVRGDVRPIRVPPPHRGRRHEDSAVRDRQNAVYARAENLEVDEVETKVFVKVSPDRWLVLEETGLALWQALEVPCAADELVERLARLYRGDPAVIAADVHATLDEWMEHGLVVVP